MKNRVLTVIAIMLLVWCIASYCNTMINIDTQAYNYAWWNLIAIIFG